MASKLVWRETEIEKEVRAEVTERLRQAAIVVRDAAKRKVAVSDKSHTYRGRVFPPGSLKKSLSYKVNSKNLTARIGTSLVYSIFQELGPVGSERRWKYTPFLRPAFLETESQVKALLGVTSGVLASNIKKLKPSDILLD